MSVIGLSAQVSDGGRESAHTCLLEMSSSVLEIIIFWE